MVCVDVMEHIERECFDAVMADLKWLTGKLLFVHAVTKPSGRKMADGRDTHICLYDEQSWPEQFTKRGFAIKRTWATGLRAWTGLMAPPC